MTVCIAAICNYGSQQLVIGAADRMVSVRDIEFEPHQAKVFPLGNSIAAMVAGDGAAQLEICVKVRRDNPGSVEAAVNRYSYHLAAYNRMQLQRRVLMPMDLELSCVLDRREDYAPEVVNQVLRDLDRERADVQTIICGTDYRGAHIYTVTSDGTAHYGNAIGFASIGIGEWHAASQFMFARYSQSVSLSRALLLLAHAKSRAEVAPGVGFGTDFFLIADKFDFLKDSICDALYAANDKFLQILDMAWEEGAKEFAAKLDEITRPIDARDAAAQPAQEAATPASKKRSRRRQS